MRKKLFSVLIAAVMLVQMIGAGGVAYAADAPTTTWQDSGVVGTAFESGSGTQADPYTISSAAQLAYLAKQFNTGNIHVDNYYWVLTADINLSGRQWIPIGTNTGTRGFRGNFDGQGHTVSGMTLLSDSGNFDLGLFAEIGSAGSVKRVAVMNPSINITDTEWMGVVGGIVGYNHGTVENCLVRGTEAISGGYSTGGIAGVDYGIIRNCVADVPVYGYQQAGGIAGVSMAYPGTPTLAITNCLSLQSVGSAIDERDARTSVLFAGAIAYNADYQPSKISYCHYEYNVGVGGNTLFAVAATDADTNSALYTNNSYLDPEEYEGTATGGSWEYDDDFFKDITYWSAPWSIGDKNSVWRTDGGTAKIYLQPVVVVPGTPTNVKATPGNGKVTVTFTPPTPNGSPITEYSVYVYDGGGTKQDDLTTTGSSSPITVTRLTNGTPYTFKVVAKNAAEEDSDESAASEAVTPSAPTTTWQDEGVVGTKYAGGSGTSEYPFRISSGAELAYLEKEINSGTDYSDTYFVLTGNIDLSAHLWVPIANNGKEFRGHFNGQGHTVSGMTLTAGSGLGLFSKVGASASVERVALIDPDINTTGDNVGGIAGFNLGTIENCLVRGTQTITGNVYVGGIVGYNSSGTIRNCVGDAPVCASAAMAGGIAGGILGSTDIIIDCLSLQSVDSPDYKGAIVGCYFDDGSPVSYSHYTDNGEGTVYAFGARTGDTAHNSYLDNYAGTAGSYEKDDTFFLDTLDATDYWSDAWSIGGSTDIEKVWTTDDSTVPVYLRIKYTPSDEKAITAFRIGNFPGTINETEHTIAVTLPSGTSVTSLTPAITVSPKASVSPTSGSAKDFTSPVIYTVTSENGLQQDYTVTVTVTSATPSSAKAITAFSINSIAGTINEAAHTIAITLPSGTSVTSLAPSITVSAKASVSPASGAARDFTSPVTYTVTAENSSTQNYTVTVTVSTSIHNVTGDVMDDAATPVPVVGATVVLMKGNTQFTSGTTDGSGQFTLTNVPDGSYNLVATEGDRTVTYYATVTNGVLSPASITLPGSKLSVLNVVGNDTPSVVVDGLNDQFTAADLDLITNNGDTVKITLRVENKGEDTPATEADALTAAATGKTIGMYLGMQVNRAVNGADQGPILTTQSLLKIVVPYDLTSKSGVAIYRYHGGEARAMTNLGSAYLNTTPSGEGYVLDTTNNQIVIWAQNFSTYAIAYSTRTPSPSSGGTTSYSIAVPASLTGGSISPSGTVSVTKGGSKTFTITPDEGYATSDVLVDGVSVGAVSTYTFESITTAHTITAVFKKSTGLPYYYDGDTKVFIGFASDASGEMKYIAPHGEKVLFTPNPKDFTDISLHWGESYIHFVTEREIFVGTGTNSFSPNTGMTRAMLATVIGRLYERSYGALSTAGANAFTDCDYDGWYGSYIDWCSENGIITGVGGGKFEPNRQVTRQEMAAMLYRFAKFMGVMATNLTGIQLNYPDTADIASWATEAATYCQSTGIIGGRDGGVFSPKGTATRAEVATIIERFIEQVVK